MCCDNWDSKVERSDDTLTECPACGEPCVFRPSENEYYAVDHCNYAKEECSTCCSAPCNQGC